MNDRGKHLEILAELHKLYVDKNTDYGDSFTKSYDEFGLVSPVIRLSDKLNRLKRLAQTDDQSVEDESIRDTVIDLANYAVMLVMELDKEDEECGIN